MSFLLDQKFMEINQRSFWKMMHYTKWKKKSQFKDEVRLIELMKFRKF